MTNMQYYPDLGRHRAAISEILGRVGTPVFLGERATVADRYRQLQRSLAGHWPRSVIGYSFKTNYLIAESGLVRELGAWAEVVSDREYRLARRLGFDGPEIVYNGPLKPDESLRAAFADGALVHLNDHHELDRVIRLAEHWPNVVEIGLRIGSTLPRLGHTRFGFSLENTEANEALEKIATCSRLKLVSLHTHLYGDTDDPDLYGLAAQRLAEFARQRIPNCRRTLKFIDLGGGFPAHSPQPKSRDSWDPRPIDTYVHRMTQALQPLFRGDQEPPTLIVEPGRYLVCDAIVLVTRVVHVNNRDGRQIVNCDGSISMVPLTHYCPQIVRAYDQRLSARTSASVPSTIYGATCRENDRLYEGLFPAVHVGDYLVHFAAGAYNSSLSPDFIFASPGLELF